jgi:hypothetical protein
MSCCTFCEMPRHNIRNCRHHGIAFVLMKLRCKHWKSLHRQDLSIIFRWLTNQDVSTLRVICIHKYKTSPKTMAKHKLVAIVMHLEFCRIVEKGDSFWMCDLPEDFDTFTFDCNNASEHAILIMNINTYQPPSDELRFKSNEDLADILMRLINDYRQSTHVNRRTRFRARINYVEIETDESREEECSICYDKITNLAILNCKHGFCCACIETHIRCTAIATVNCPLCRGEIESITAVQNGNESLISIL